MNIRKAIKKDAHSIANIQVKAWQLAYKGIMPKAYLASLSIDEKTKDWSNALSEKGPGNNLVVEDDGLVVGFCVFGPARDKDLSTNNHGELVALNVLPDYWGKGLGSALIKTVFGLAKLEKREALFLWVLEKNYRARAVYEEQGFTLEEKEKFDNHLTGHKSHEVRYVKQLLF